MVVFRSGTLPWPDAAFRTIQPGALSSVERRAEFPMPGNAIMRSRDLAHHSGIESMSFADIAGPTRSGQVGRCFLWLLHLSQPGTGEDCV